MYALCALCLVFLLFLFLHLSFYSSPVDSTLFAGEKKWCSWVITIFFIYLCEREDDIIFQPNILNLWKITTIHKQNKTALS